MEYTRDLRGFVDVDLLEEKASRYKPNMAVVRSLRLTKYVLATLIYLTKGDPKYIDDLKPAKEFFEKHPHLAAIRTSRKDVDTVLLALYNELPRKFVADTSPRYRIKALLERDPGRPVEVPRRGRAAVSSKRTEGSSRRACAR